jgi:leucyl/phenylalanyl-tRNA--protein transferase
VTSHRIAWLTPADPPDSFPPVETALSEPDGLLAAGGDLSTERLVEAYTRGIFPWFDKGQPILWWSPNPRCVLRPDRYHRSRRFRRSLKQSAATISFNQQFSAVMDACAAPRPGQPGTWITAEMHTAYRQLHDAGWAHSVEVLDGPDLIGGLYGVAIGNMFFAESMFSRRSNGSKIALTALCDVLDTCRVPLIDCQVVSGHLLRIGAEEMPRGLFVEALKDATTDRSPFTLWPEGTMRARELA